jgi:hypothetical protein
VPAAGQLQGVEMPAKLIVAALAAVAGVFAFFAATGGLTAAERTVRPPERAAMKLDTPPREAPKPLRLGRPAKLPALAKPKHPKRTAHRKRRAAAPAPTVGAAAPPPAPAAPAPPPAPYAAPAPAPPPAPAPAPAPAPEPAAPPVEFHSSG